MSYGGTILLVEDEESVRRVAKKILEKMCFNVISAENGLDALRLIQENEVDLVFCDLIMPGMGGHEVSRQIRELFPTMPIILTSGCNQDELKEGQLAEPWCFLCKPYVVQQLRDAISHVLGVE